MIKESPTTTPADESFNGNLSAIPKDEASPSQENADLDLVSTQADFGDMNPQDAYESGYIEADDIPEVEAAIENEERH